MESILVQVDKMEDTLTTRDADIEAELAETTTSIEEIKSSLASAESNIIGICKEHTNVRLQPSYNLVFKISFYFLENCGYFRKNC